MTKRLHAMGSPRYANGFGLTLHEDLLELPTRWRQPKTIFVNSMSDLFHSEVPLDTGAPSIPSAKVTGNSVQPVELRREYRS